MSNEKPKTAEIDGDGRDDRARGSSRLGKEAKIGISVIAMLLLVLGIVATVRLTKSNADDDIVAVDAPKDAKQEAGDSTSTASMLGDAAPNRFSKRGPTTIPAVPASTIAPKIVSDWKDKSETAKAKSASRVPSGPPSFAPPTSTPPEGDRFSRFAGKSKSESRDAKLAEETKDTTAYAIKDAPKRHRKDANIEGVENVADDAKPLPGMHPLRPEGSVGESGVVNLKKPERMRDRQQLVAVEPPATLPGYRDNSIPEAAPPMPPQSTVNTMPQRSPYSGGLETVTPTQYDGGGYGSESQPMARGGNGQSQSQTGRSYSPAPRRDDGKYEVQPNDSYWTISERLYGTGAYFKAMAQHNRGKDGEDNLRPGELILAPTLAELEKTYPDLCPTAGHRDAMQSQGRASMVSTRGRGGRTYTVVEGDTLFNIARYELGKASRWAELYEMNRDVLGKDFNYLKPGTQLAMPASERGDSIASPPNRGYTR